MKKTLRLLKDWENKGTKWKLGQLIAVDEHSAGSLVSEGIAEIYEPSADDVVTFTNKDGGGVGREELTEILAEVHAKHLKKISDEADGTPAELKTGGYCNMADFATDVRKAGINGGDTPERLASYLEHLKAFGLQEAMGHDGGFLVPTEFKNQLMRNILEKSIILPRATQIPMATSSIELPIVQETTHVGSVYGGIIVYKPAEAGTKLASQPKFGKVRLNLHKLIALVYATEELLDDSPISIEPLLNTMAAEALAFQLDEDFIFGTGAGEALGIENANALVGITGTVTSSINSADVLEMWSRLLPSSQGKAIWLANLDTFATLASLVIGTATVNQAVGLLQYNAGGISAPTFTTMLGRPIFFTEHCETLGTSGDIILADWSQYLVGQKAGGAMKAATSIHLKFLTDEVAFRFVMRYDGQPWMQAPLTPKHSSKTLSPFVDIDTRSS